MSDEVQSGLLRRFLPGAIEVRNCWQALQTANKVSYKSLNHDLILKLWTEKYQELLLRSILRLKCCMMHGAVITLQISALNEHPLSSSHYDSTIVCHGKRNSAGLLGPVDARTILH